MSRIQIILAFICCSATTFGQFFTNYTTADGLSNMTINDILEDDRGFIWIATNDGLNRFNGGSFRVFHHDPADSTSLPHDEVMRMALAPSGKIWMTTSLGMLVRFDPITERFSSWQQVTGEDDPINTKAVDDVYCYTDDSIFVACRYNAGTVLFLPEQKRHLPLGQPNTHKPSTKIAPLANDPNKAWVSSRDSLLLLDMRICEFVPHLLPTSNDRSINVMTSITDVHQGSNGTMWVTHWGGGLWEASPGDTVWKTHLLVDVFPLAGARNIFARIEPVGDGKFWISTERGVVEFIPGKGIQRLIANDPDDPFSLAPGIVVPICLSANGTWVGTKSGLSAFDPAKNVFQTTYINSRPGSPDPKPSISGMVQLGPDLLISSTVGEGLLHGVLQDDLRLGELKKVNGPWGTRVWGIERTKAYGMLLFSGEGIFELDMGTYRVKHSFDKVFNEHGPMYHLGFLEDHEGVLWMGRQNNGIYRWTPGTEQVERFTDDPETDGRLLDGEWCVGLVEDRDHYIWSNAYSKGLQRIDPTRSQVEHFPTEDNEWLTAQFIWDLVIDQQNRLWMGTRGKGVIVTPAHDPGGAGTMHLAAKQGLSSMISSLMIDDNGDCWATGTDLYRISGSDFSVRKFDHNEGVRSMSFHHADPMQHPNGMISMTPGGGAVVTVDPDGVPDLSALSMVYIRGIEVNGSTWESDTTSNFIPELVLDHD